MDRRSVLGGLGTVLAGVATAGCNAVQGDPDSRGAPDSPTFQRPSTGARCAQPGERFDLRLRLEDTSRIKIWERALSIDYRNITSDPAWEAYAQRYPPLLEFGERKPVVNATVPVAVPPETEPGEYALLVDTEDASANVTINVGGCEG